MTQYLFSADLYPFFVRSFVRPARPINQKNKKMQNKPNLCRFQAKNSCYEKKQTQTNPIQTQNKAIFNPPAAPQSQNKPNSNPIPSRQAFWFDGVGKVGYDFWDRELVLN